MTLPLGDGILKFFSRRPFVSLVISIEFRSVSRTAEVKISVHQAPGSKIAMGWYLFEAKSDNRTTLPYSSS